MSDRRQQLHACRAQFGLPPRHLEGPAKQAFSLQTMWLQRAMWAWHKDELAAIPRAEKVLREQGRVVWGCLVQANQLLFDAKNTMTLPASVIFSPDHYFDERVDTLLELALNLFRLKGESPANPALAQVAAGVTDELSRQMLLRLPDQLTQGREVFQSTLLINPAHLPANALAARHFPLVICPEQTPAVMILPASYWPADLRETWLPFDTMGAVCAVRDHCLQLPGVQRSGLSCSVLGDPRLRCLELSVDQLPPRLTIRCLDSVREPLERGSPTIAVADSNSHQQTNWHWTTLLLEGSIPLPTVLSLVTQSYQLTMNAPECTADQKFCVSLLQRQLQPPAVLDQLVASYKLSPWKQELEQLARPAGSLRSVAVADSDIPVGSSKLGGLPDLPTQWTWPVHASGRPLTFFAQLNLAEIAQAVLLPELPTSGILYFFSACGWPGGPGSPPQMPPDPKLGGWTQVAFCPNPAGALARRTILPGGNVLAAEMAFARPTVTLPDLSERVVQRMTWGSGERELYASRFRPMYHVVRDFDVANPPRHQLLGYANFPRQFLPEVATAPLQLLLQLSGAPNSGAAGGAGLLHFWIKPDELRRLDFSRVFCTSE